MNIMWCEIKQKLALHDMQMPEQALSLLSNDYEFKFSHGY